MDGENNGKPYEQMDDLGGKPTIFGVPSIWPCETWETGDFFLPTQMLHGSHGFTYVEKWWKMATRSQQKWRKVNIHYMEHLKLYI